MSFKKEIRDNWSAGVTVKLPPLKQVKEFADRVINPGGNAGEVMLADGKLYIEIKDASFGNFIDCKSMMSMLAFVQKLGIVTKDVQTMWVGAFDPKMIGASSRKPKAMYLWCSTGK